MSEALPDWWRRLATTPLTEFVQRGATGSLDWRALIQSSPLPQAAKALVEQTVRCTRLKRQERCAVAEELVAHFRDGLDSGATV